MGKPNVITIMADQLRYDALGEHTPNINKLMESSVEFDNAYCASPLCVPGRGAFFTGKYPNVTGSLHNAKIPQERHKGIVGPEHENLYGLMESDWDSWHAGKMDFRTAQRIEHDENSKTNWLPLEPRYYEFLENRGKRRPGGDNFKGVVPELVGGKTTKTTVVSTPTVGCYEEGMEHFYDGFILNDCLHAIGNRDKDKPMLLNAMFFAPHPPIDIPEPFFSQIKDVELPENVGVWGGNQSPLQLYNLSGVLGASQSREDWREVWKKYIGFVALLDDCVGRLIEKLKEEGIYEDSVIIFTSDHGEMLGSHRLWQKMCMYEESIKTPLSIRFPDGKLPGEKVIKENVSSVDMVPTLCDYLGLEAPNDCSGVSLLPLLEGQKLERESIFVQYEGNGSSSNFSRCVINGDNKLIVDFFKDEIFIELYNTSTDKQERINHVFEKENKELIESLLSILRLHMEETEDSLVLPRDIYSRFINTYAEYSV